MMMFSARAFTATCLAALALSFGASAAPVTAPAPVPTNFKPQEFDVYTPPITAPNTTTVWHTGETQIVTWNTDSLDDAGKNATGYLLLGHLENNSENLDIKHPLAHGFHLGDGQANVTVPNVPTRDDYIVVLLGDSGNASPMFTIQNPSS